jgi:hypothetical protein
MTKKPGSSGLTGSISVIRASADGDDDSTSVASPPSVALGHL